MFDYLIIGTGLFGCVFAREMTDRGYKCLVIDRRSHLGGNVYTEKINGINVHKYGAHIFHTNDKSIWNYVNRFAVFNNYRHKVFVKNKEKLFSFPINLMTLNQLWGINKPDEAYTKLQRLRIENNKPGNLEEWILSQVGVDLYELFIKDYTLKQWGRSPRDLPASIIKRIPIRTDFNDFYFDDRYQGIPEGGYTDLIKEMLSGIEIKLGVDYLQWRTELNLVAKKIVYTGAIDDFFDHEFGTLEYRSVNFVQKNLDVSDFQGTAVVNYTNQEVAYTRIIEHKHFEFGKQPNTIITEEYPLEWKKGIEPYYPINDERNNKIYNCYKNKAKAEFPNVIFGGRLAEYRYYDMHQVIASALHKVSLEIKSQELWGQ